MVEAFLSLVRAFGARNVAVVGAGVAVLALLVVFIAPTLSPKAEKTVDIPVSGATTPTSTEVIDVSSLTVPASVEDELASTILDAAKNDLDVAWIVKHADLYDEDGDAVQRKLLKLAATEPDAVSFVRGYVDNYPQESGQPYTEAVTVGDVPRLYQWDSRWGYTVYSSATFALTGCCPTSLSMVYMGLTGDTSLTPYEMGQRARSGGYEDVYAGTDAAFLEHEAASCGLSCEAVDVDADAVRTRLEQGYVLICNVGEGDFTESGHYLVVCGLDESGDLVVNDPFSAVRSEQSWDVDTVVSQAKAFWAFAVA